MKNCLMHHGVLGQKWGIRNGPPYPLNRYDSKNVSKANDIYSTLNKKEKYYLTAEKDSNAYVTEEEYKSAANVFSFIQQYKDVPISVIDIWANEDNIGEVSIAVRNDKKFRGKGYGSNALEQGIIWLKKHPEISELQWGVHKDNIASIKLAEKYGFIHDKSKDYDKEWLTYIRKNV